MRFSTLPVGVSHNIEIVSSSSPHFAVPHSLRSLSLRTRKLKIYQRSPSITNSRLLVSNRLLLLPDSTKTARISRSGSMKGMDQHHYNQSRSDKLRAISFRSNTKLETSRISIERDLDRRRRILSRERRLVTSSLQVTKVSATLLFSSSHLLIFNLCSQTHEQLSTINAKP